MGGKFTIADEIWQRLGDVRNFVEPFFGSGAVLLNRPQPFRGTETVNDINAWLTNFWRALQAAPDEVAKWADWPVSELDLHARGDWLFYREGVAEFVEKLRGDPDFYDAKSAGWWVWGQCCWIGEGWGPRKRQGVNRQLVHVGDAGQGVNRKLVDMHHHRSGVVSKSVGNRRPKLQVGCNETGCVGIKQGGIYDYLRELAERVRRVRVCCGDWSRVCGPTPTIKQGLTAIFLDPPYNVADRDQRCYGDDDDKTVSAKVRKWCLRWQDHPLMRICLAGYEGEHDMPASWECVKWKAHGGYGNQNKTEEGNQNCERERLWFSPNCLRNVDAPLFAEEVE
jgi:site-specific DNA-adenine methylase